MQFDLMWLKAKKFLSKKVSMLKARSSAKKEMKRINFTFANESPRRTFKQFDDLQKRTYFFDKLTDVKDGKISYKGMISFVDFILQESIPKGNPRVFVQGRTFAFNQNTFAQFVPLADTGKGCVEISSRRILEVLGGERNFLDLIISLGHERKHYFQYLGKLKMKKFSEKKLSKVDDREKQIFADLDKEEFQWTEIGNIIGLLWSDLNGEFIKEYSELAENEKLQFKRMVVYSQYAQSKAEEDARAGGIAFAKQFVESVVRDEMCDRHLRKWLVGQLTVFEERIQEEKETRESYVLYRDFQEYLSKIPVKRIAEIGSNIENKLRVINYLNSDCSNLNRPKLQLSAMDAYRKLVSIYLEGKSREELVEFLCNSVKNQYVQLGLATKWLLNEKFGTKKNGEDLVSDKIEEIFSTEELTVETILSFGNLLRTEQSLKLIGGFLKENKIRFAISLCSSIGNKSALFKHIAYNSIFKNAEQMFSKFEKGEKDVVIADFLELKDFIEDFDIDYSFGKELGVRGETFLHRRAEKLLKRFEENKERMLEMSEANEEYQTKLTEKVYGKKEVEFAKKWEDERKEWKKFSQGESSSNESNADLLRLPQ